jgi:two-component system chemotaxis response regulator CheB
MTIKVLIIDDSVAMCQILHEIINSQKDLEVVGVAQDPLIAREKIKSLNPDVLTLDVEMPRMDGLTFLEKLMRLRPMPVVMVSSLTEENAEATFRALELGAVDFVTKPRAVTKSTLNEYSEVITEKIRAAARVAQKISQVPHVPENKVPRKVEATSISPQTLREKIIVIGASTGGTEAVKDILVQLPKDVPPILIVQHMPETFTKMFAKRLDNLCAISVKEAEDQEHALPGHAYVAPGDFHMSVDKKGRDYILRLDKNPAVNRHRPAVDVLFNSAADCGGKNVIGVILTGMGSDGASGIRKLKLAGAYNFAQDQASSIIFGMPKAAIDTGGIDKIVSISDLPQQILACLKNQFA